MYNTFCNTKVFVELTGDLNLRLLKENPDGTESRNIGVTRGASVNGQGAVNIGLDALKIYAGFKK